MRSFAAATQFAEIAGAVAYTFGFSRVGPGPYSDAERARRGWPTTIVCRERSIPFQPKELKEFGVAVGVGLELANKQNSEANTNTCTVVQHEGSTLSPNKAASRIER